MTSVSRAGALRAALTAAAVSALALLAACAEPPPPAPPPPPPPPISLAPKLIEQASAYRFYLARSSAISPAFADGGAIAEALRTGAAYEPRQLIEGATAYGAIAALQDPAFVAGVRAYAANAETRRQIAHEIIRDPAYAVGISGSASAAALVKTALGEDGAKYYATGKAVKDAAYSVQKERWSKTDVANRDLRLTQAKTLSATAVVGDLAETARLQAAATGNGSLGLVAAETPASPPYTPIVVRSLAIAALSVLGEATDENLETLKAIMLEPNANMCLSMAKLNLYQCLAVSRPHYEDVFCLGQHAMMDTARCVIKASGQPEPYEPRFVPQVATQSVGYTPTPAKPPAKKR